MFYGEWQVISGVGEPSWSPKSQLNLPLIQSRFEFGEVAEWPNVPDSKSGVPQGTVGSNPTLSANLSIGRS